MNLVFLLLLVINTIMFHFLCISFLNYSHLVASFVLVPGETGNGVGQLLSLRHPKSGLSNSKTTYVKDKVQELSTTVDIHEV